jgi:hypothetical protein
LVTNFISPPTHNFVRQLQHILWSLTTRIDAIVDALCGRAG